MMTRRGAVAAAAFVMAVGMMLHLGAQTQPAGIRRIDLQRHDLSTPGREALQTIVELAPGVASTMHTHPGEELVFVLEGAPLRYALEGRAPVTLMPGQVLFIPAGTAHRATNVGTTTGAELATYIVETGKPLLSDVGDRSSR